MEKNYNLRIYHPDRVFHVFLDSRLFDYESLFHSKCNIDYKSYRIHDDFCMDISGITWYVGGSIL